MNYLKCFVCDEECLFYCSNILSLKSTHTETFIMDILEKIIGCNIDTKRYPETDDKQIMCQDCCIKIDEYDLACLTVQKIESDFRLLLTQTAEKYEYKQCIADAEKHKSEIITYELEIDHCVNDIDNSTNLVKNIDQIIENSEVNNIIKPTTLVVLKTTKKIPTKKTSTKEKSTSDHIRQKQVTLMKCAYCSLEFQTKSTMKKHLRNHIPDLQFRCELCATPNKSYDDLNKHMIKHEGRSSLQCPDCDAKFKKRTNLMRHMPVHTGEHLFQCEICGKRFRHHSSIRLHSLAHKNLREKVCPTCGLKFYSTSHLNRHLRIHTGAKPFACPVCDKKFAQRYNMMLHHKVHTKVSTGKMNTKTVKSHPCTMCKASFSKYAQLLQHCVSYHDIVAKETL